MCHIMHLPTSQNACLPLSRPFNTGMGFGLQSTPRTSKRLRPFFWRHPLHAGVHERMCCPNKLPRNQHPGPGPQIPCAISARLTSAQSARKRCSTGQIPPASHARATRYALPKKQLQQINDCYYRYVRGRQAFLEVGMRSVSIGRLAVSFFASSATPKVKDISTDFRRLTALGGNFGKNIYWYINTSWLVSLTGLIDTTVLPIVSQLQYLCHFSKHRVI